MKKILILENNNGRLANQLWHFANIYAYCLEKGYNCENYAFFRYWHYFNFTVTNNLIRLFFGDFYRRHKNIKFTKLSYSVYVTLLKIIHYRYVARDERQKFLLAPSVNLDEKQKNILRAVEASDHTWYFCGWLFSNPDGLKKYRHEICEYFQPREQYYRPIVDYVKKLKDQYKLVVGVHIRQGDYKTWCGGQYYFTCSEVRRILDDFISNQTVYKTDDIVFILCSDGDIDKESFVGLNIINGLGTEIEDLYTLAAADLIIGSSSTYGSWAAYYGDIPYVRFSHEKIDWEFLYNKFLLC